jgi:superfamily II DNA/RNA helicase
MRALIGELSQTGIRYSVLFCEYQATLDYLRSAVQDLELADFAIHSGMTVEAREHTFSQFREDGGFLIATSAASQFLSMSFVEAVIHYDLPLSSRAFSERVGLYLGFGRSIACNTYCLEDETGALPIEAIQLQIARAPDSGSIEMDVDLDALFKRYLG